MPFYEYECENCKFYTELLQKVSDAPLRKCPSCGKNAMKKLVSAPVFRLKGGGWYETDFKGDKENKRNLAVEKEPDTSSDSKPAKAASDTKAESKPAESTSTAESKSAGSGAGASEPSSSRGRGTSSGSGRGAGSAPAGRSGGAARKPAASSRASASAKSRTKPKAKPAARRKGR